MHGEGCIEVNMRSPVKPQSRRPHGLGVPDPGHVPGSAGPSEHHAAAVLYLVRVSAGFPSPADDYVEGALDLNAYLVRHPAATFMVRVSGDSMIGAGIAEGDILIVDRSEEAADGRIVVAVLDGEMTVKRLHVRKGQLVLRPENPNYAELVIREGQEAQVWGVVTGVVRRV